MTRSYHSLEDTPGFTLLCRNPPHYSAKALKWWEWKGDPLSVLYSSGAPNVQNRRSRTGLTLTSLVARIFFYGRPVGVVADIDPNQYQPPDVGPKKSAETLCQGLSGILDGFNGS